MNSFNHYAYGAIVGWLYRCAAGIVTDPSVPGFKKLRLAPKPDRRFGFLKASYRTPAGLVKSEWRYEGEKWIWAFAIPEGVTADVILPGESEARRYTAGDHVIRK